MNLLNTMFGIQVPLVAQMLVMFGVLFGFLALLWFIVRRIVPGPRVGLGAGRGRQPRLGVLDWHSVDPRRKLVLIRRDNVEHLIMIGGPNDVVIESTILRGRPQARPAPQANAQQPPAAAPGAPEWPQPHPLERNHASPPERAPQHAPMERPEPAMAERPEPVMAERVPERMPMAPPQPTQAPRPTRQPPPQVSQAQPARRASDAETVARIDQAARRAPTASRMRAEPAPAPPRAAEQTRPVDTAELEASLFVEAERPAPPVVAAGKSAEPAATQTRQEAATAGPAAPEPPPPAQRASPLRLPELRIPELRIPGLRRTEPPPLVEMENPGPDTSNTVPERADRPASKAREAAQPSASPAPVIPLPDGRPPEERQAPAARSFATMPNFTPRLKREAKPAAAPQPEAQAPTPPEKPKPVDPFASLEEEMANLLGRSSSPPKP
jgi:hypothetical protein